MVGNFIADGVKGKKYEKLPTEIARGVMMHRAIDHFMDNHHLTEQGKKRLRPMYGKYSAVIIDIYYDHLLAKAWRTYSDVELGDFAKQCYQVLGNYYELFPERSRQFYYYMVQNDILSQYATIVGIEKVLSGMSRRTSFKSNMETAANELQEYMHKYESEFKAFFPEIIAYLEKEFGD